MHWCEGVTVNSELLGDLPDILLIFCQSRGPWQVYVRMFTLTVKEINFAVAFKFTASGVHQLQQQL